MILRNNNGGIIDRGTSLYVARHVGEVAAGSIGTLRLGLKLMHGLGTRRNMPGALEHFAIAAAHGDALAESRWR